MDKGKRGGCPGPTRGNNYPIKYHIKYLNITANDVMLTDRLPWRSFVVFGPATWNSLPPLLRAPELSLSTFKRLPKTQLFQHA